MRLRVTFTGVLWGIALGWATGARAEFILSSAILEFHASGPRQQDIELVSRSDAPDYIVSEVSEILNPGRAEEQRVVLDDPGKAGLLVTPEKTVLGPGARKLMRFVLMREPDTGEHIYRVTIKPVIKGVDAQSRIGLKVLIGYEALVIVRPVAPSPAYSAVRQGRSLVVTNSGNTNVLFQNGKQCAECALPPVVRVYAGQQATVTLPLDRGVSYTVWDGISTVEKAID